MNQPHSLARTVAGIALLIFGTAGVGFARDEGVKQVEQGAAILVASSF